MTSASTTTHPGGDRLLQRPPDRAALRGMDEAARLRLGAAADTSAAVLHELAQDPRATVRSAVAMNPAAPPLADRLLLADENDRVRTLFARRIATLIPSVPQAQRTALEEYAFATLARLVEDTAVRVRAAVADAVKEMPHAPRELILRLARDSAMPVCGPVIRLSPLLMPEDLLALLADAPSAATASAVAGRPNLHESVCDVIAAGTDTLAITALLSNRSAMIREATLDALVARTVQPRDWHDPMVHRPALSARAARALADIVATHLLGALAARGDLDPPLAEELRRRLAARMAPLPAVRSEPTRDEVMAQAVAMLAEGRLDEPAIVAAAQRGEARACSALLAVAAEVSMSAVERAVTLRSAKGLVSLVWKAGFSMRVAVMLQVLLCRFDTGAILRGPVGGSFPLAIEEMRWQLQFLQRLRR